LTVIWLIPVLKKQQNSIDVMMVPGGGTPWWGDLSQADHSQETFKYDHPLAPLVLLVSKTLEVQCPGCGDMKRMLVRHIKTDQACAARCSSIDMESFDRQLKRFRHRRQMRESKQRKREESEAVFSHRTEYKKRRVEERHYENEEKHKNGSSFKDYMEMRGFQNEFPSTSYGKRDEKGKEQYCGQENKVKRELSDDGLRPPPSKLRKEGHRERFSEGVHILTIGEFDKKEELRSPTDTKDGVDASEEDKEKESGENLKATLGSGRSGATTPTSLGLAESTPSVPNSLSPTQMVEAMKYLLETDDSFVHRLHEAYLKTLQRR